MTTAWLSLRERARRFLKREAVRWGVLCIHEIDSKAWRPCVSMSKPARLCGYCDQLEWLTEADFYARFGRAFNGGRV